MTHGSSDRLDQIEALLQRSIIASDERMTRFEQSSNERMTRIEQSMEVNRIESNERLTRIEQAVESNNRFLEAFGRDVKRFTETANNLTNRIDGIIFTANQDRQETNSRYSGIQRQVTTIDQKIDRLLGDSDQPH